MNSDDLTPFLARGESNDFGFRQGYLVSFNQLTGANQVSVGGTVLTDLPLLNTGDSVNYSAGNVVVLMRMRSSWAILGRVITPGSTELARGAAAVHRVMWDTVTTYALTTSLVTKITHAQVAPVWATYYQVHATADMGAINSTAAQDYGRLRIEDQAGSFTYGETPDTAAGLFTSCSTSLARGGVISGGETLSVAARVQSNTAGWASSAANRVNLNSAWTFSRYL